MYMYILDTGMYMYMYVRLACTYTVHIVIVVSWFLQYMGYVLREVCMYSLRLYIQHEGGTIPCTVKIMRQLTCTDRPYKATARLASAPEYSTLAVQRKVPYTRCCSYSSIA